MTLNETQRLVLEAACNAIFHSHTGEEAAQLASEAPQYDKLKSEVSFLIGSNFTDLGSDAIEELLSQYQTALSTKNFNELLLTLSILSTRAGTLLLTGHVTPFHLLTLEEREKVMQAWSTSKLLVRRKAFRAFSSITLFVAYSYEKCALATGYPAKGDPLRATRQGTHYPFRFESVSTSYQVINTDVLVIGSGAGGGVVSSQLAEKGWKVLVVEKGAYVRPEDLAGTPKEGFKTLFESKGLMVTEEGGVSVLAGSCLGGGTTVNWSASLAPQHYVREEWARKHGLPHFLSPEFARSLDFVRDRMGVSTDAIKHNRSNQILYDSCHKLGYDVKLLPQNTNRQEHPCGFCSFGCTACIKQGGTVTWLKDAALAGTRFLVDSNVEHLLFAASSTHPRPSQSNLHEFFFSPSRQRCIGALVRAKDGTRAIVCAKQAVVLSAGSINSPAVLLRSGLKNKRIGKNLKLHPTTFVTGYYKEDIKPWEGAIMTAVSSVKENRDGSHHGCKIEVNMSFPSGSGAAFLPWKGSQQQKELMLKYNHSFTLVVIARDRGSGQVFIDKDGVARMTYDLHPYDSQSMLEGVIAACEVHLVGGAERIVTAQLGVDEYVPAEGHLSLNDPKWLAWVDSVRKGGVLPSWSSLGSAHQMGSCQMGISPKSSVVSPRGRVWGTEGLYVADASVFPSASGVNPMITNMAISHSISQYINEDLKMAASLPVRARL